MENQRVTDLSYLEEITGGEPEALKEFIQMFFDQLPEFKEGLRNYFNEGKWSELGDLAHKAKSSVMTFGMNDLGHHLKSLQLKTQKLEEIDTYESHVVEFEKTIAKAEKELEEDMKRL